jgi:hypothetical protein
MLIGNLGRTIFTDVSEKIAEFSQRLKQLKQQFEHGTDIQTLFFSAKIVKDVETLGISWSLLYFLQLTLSE